MGTIVDFIKTVIQQFDFKKECIQFALDLPMAFLLLCLFSTEISYNIFNSYLTYIKSYDLGLYMLYLHITFLILGGIMRDYFNMRDFIMKKYFGYPQSQ